LIVVDSSAFVAMIFEESEAERFRDRLRAAQGVFASAATVLETSMVVGGRFGTAGLGRFDRLLASFEFEIVPFDSSHAELGRDAFLRYGKGRHPARLNFGDCIAYGLAKALGLPLLHKGTDFAATDLRA